MTRGRFNKRSAFTLLEMLLAVTVLSMIGVLVATMLTQASDLHRDNDRRDATLDITRVVRLMTEQWEDRRSAVALGRNGESYAAAPGELAFVTARPILKPEWPLAIVRYRMELIGASIVEAERRYDLVYEERPVAAVGVSTETPKDDQEKEAQWRSAEKIVLLRDCVDLRLERFRSAQDAVLEELGPRSGAEGEGGDDAAAEIGAGASLEERQAEMLRTAKSSWVVFEKPLTRAPSAVRIVGEYEGEVFACVFVGAASR